MKKALILLAVMALSFGAFSCGGGAGSANQPPGENPGVPSVVQLSPSHFIAQTNSSITLHAKVLDGNGAPVKGVAVTFTNLSEPFGTLKPLGTLSVTQAFTNSQGIASVNLFATTSGFATIMAQVNTGVGIVRDRKTIFFSSLDVLAVSMDLDVDSVPGNGIYNELSDFTLFEVPFDNTVVVRATVRNAGGLRVAGVDVSWSADLTGDNIEFLAGTETITDLNGEARAVVKIKPESIRNTETHVNIMASAGNGAANMVTIFLNPVVIDTAESFLSANPSIVDIGGTSDITAVVILNTGAFAPNGTTVNFTTTCGTITPFGQTTDGVATAEFTAPSTPGTCTVTGKVEGVVIGSVDILVIVPLSVLPPSQTIDGVAGGTVTFTIFGGVPAYTIASSNPLFPPVPATVTASGGTFTVTVPANTPTTTVTYTIRDQRGQTVTATLNIQGLALSVFPDGITVNEGESITFTILGGAAPYNFFTSNSAATPATGTVTPPPSTFTITFGAGICTAVPPATTCTTDVTVTVIDSKGATATATITVNGT